MSEGSSSSASTTTKPCLVEGSISVNGEQQWAFSHSAESISNNNNNNNDDKQHEGALGNLLRDMENIRKQSNDMMTQMLKSQPAAGNAEVEVEVGGDDNELSDDSGDEGSSSSKKTPKKQKKGEA